MKGINSKKQKGQNDAYKLRLRVAVDKEVDIYIAGHLTYLPYKEEIKSEVYVQVMRRISGDKPTSYLKKAARQTMYQQIRDITSSTRKSNIRLLATSAPQNASGAEKKESQEDYCERCALDAGMLDNYSPLDVLVGKETEQLVEQLLNQSSATLRTLIKDRLAGISIRESASKLGLAKSTAFDLISDFKSKLVELLG